jgi:prepilin-type N-terminal cleavage/methylation domain-containing protein
MKRAGNRRQGFTLVEVLVAVSIAVVLCGLCIAIYVKVNAMKSRSEKLLFLTEEANNALGRIARDLEGLYVGGSTLAGYWKAEEPDGALFHKLTVLTATENAGKADYCTVSYYVRLDPDKKKRLYRRVSADLGGVAPDAPLVWPDEAVLVEDADSITFSALPAAPADGKVPQSVTVTLQLSDPGGTPGYRRFTVTLRPGSEEN